MRRSAADRRARRGLSCERELPLVGELFVVDRLEALDAGRRVRARGDAFEMHDRRCGFVVHLVSGRAHGECEVGVFVVGRRVAHVEPAEPAEQIRAHEDRGARAIVGFATERVARIVRIVEAAVVPAGAVAEDDAAGFLQARIRIDQFCADEAGIRRFLDAAHERVEPAGGHLRVVVEEDQQLALRGGGAGVARADEAEIRGVAHDADAFDVGEARRGRVARGVVDDDDFERNRARVRGERAQACGRVRDLVVDGHHDRDARRVAGRDREACEIFARRCVRDACARRSSAAQLRDDARERAAEAALRDAAAHARERRAHVCSAECEPCLDAAEPRVPAAQRCRDAPRRAADDLLVARLEVAQLRIERLRPARALAELAIERVAPVAAALAFGARFGELAANDAFAIAEMRDRLGANGFAQRIGIRPGQRIARGRTAAEMQHRAIARSHRRQCRFGMCRDRCAHLRQRGAIAQQRRDAIRQRVGVRFDEETVDTVADALGERADACRDDRHAEAAQLGQRVAEGFGDGRQQQRRVGCDARDERRAARRVCSRARCARRARRTAHARRRRRR